MVKGLHSGAEDIRPTRGSGRRWKGSGVQMGRVRERTAVDNAAMEASTATRPRAERRLLPAQRGPRSLRAATDETLVELARRGDDAAFEALYDRYHRGILAFCRHMLGAREESEDAVQQTFLSAYGAIRRSSRHLHARPWLYTIARNRCLSMLRARSERAGADAGRIPSTEGLADTAERRADLRAMLADLGRLPDDQRAALVLAELGDLSHG